MRAIKTIKKISIMRFLLKTTYTQFAKTNDCASSNFFLSLIPTLLAFYTDFFILLCSGNSLNSIKMKLLIFITSTIFIRDIILNWSFSFCAFFSPNFKEITRWQFLTHFTLIYHLHEKAFCINQNEPIFLIILTANHKRKSQFIQL